ncbi:efflux RND transporter permease subunit [Motilimonas sp. E26]|uniref:efflux RND transporter permease subunit n=1 Tax=Motilimonas sp. E26 TaxID=2865674 RepID=UPI001E407A50|nr:efflux RND transporter permease subunit [Motilimonas sp. E26]MCE0557383.1 efflux RND transporter permease subunit [Motilimonas sp. E26]
MIKMLVHNTRLLVLALVVLIVSGLGAIHTLPRMEDPRISNRFATVITHFPGASAERVEALISEKIESKIRKLPEIKVLTSTSRPGISVIQAELKDHITQGAPVWSRIRDLLSDITPELPPGSSVPQLDDDRGYAFTRIIALTWQGGTQPDLAILGRYGRELQNRLRLIPGTDFVEVQGAPEEEILVELDLNAASALRLTGAQVAQLINTADAKVSAGELHNNDNTMQLELRGELDSLERIRQIPLLSDSKGFVYRVGDLAEVKRSIKTPESSLAIINGQQGIVVSARMLPDLRIDTWSASLDRSLNEFSQQLPSNILSQVIFDQNDYTQTRLSELMGNVLFGFAIISVVLLLTLGWRSALIVALSLPITVLFTLSCMKYFGLPIHQMSVTGLVVALGIMVDNAIVMVDSIGQKRHQGMSALFAVQRSLKHLWLPLLGSTLTTILAFMPIILMPGPAGEFVGGIALSVIFSLIGSYLISHTILASIAGRFLRQKEANHRWYQNGIQLPSLANLFKKTVRLSLNYPKLSVILVFLVPVSGFYGAGQLTEQFFPPSDRDMFHIEMFLAPQTSIERTRAVTAEVDEILAKYQGIESVHWFIGNNAPTFYYNLLMRQQGAQNYAQAMITADHFSTANRLIHELQAELDKAVPEAQILVRQLEQGPPFNAPIEVRLYGQNLDQLKTLGDEVRALLFTIPDVLHTRGTLLAGTPKVWLNVNEEASRVMGLGLTEIADQLESTTQGKIGSRVIESTESIPIRIRIAPDARQELSDLNSLNVTSNQQGMIPLSGISEFELAPSRGAIPRRDGERVNVIEAYLTQGVLPASVLSQLKQKLEQSQFTLPSGYRLEFGGESAKRNDAVGNLLASLGLVMTLLVTVVVLSFNSFRLSLLIMLTAVQAAGLGLLSVYLGQFPFGFTVIIGLLGLIGLAINAAIVILAELKSNPYAMAGNKEAALACVMSCTRHITSTTITTVGGFLPLILAGGGFWPPFAIAIAGGTALTTLVSFYFVPAGFLLLRGNSNAKAVLAPQPT